MMATLAFPLDKKFNMMYLYSKRSLFLKGGKGLLFDST